MMTVGEVLDALATADVGAPVYFDFGGCVPTTVHSWRGSYDEPALGWEPPNGVDMTVIELIVELEKCTDGHEYTGYKGGEYAYNRHNTLHIDNYGRYTNTELVTVEVNSWCVYLITQKED